MVTIRDFELYPSPFPIALYNAAFAYTFRRVAVNTEPAITFYLAEMGTAVARGILAKTLYRRVALLCHRIKRGLPRLYDIRRLAQKILECASDLICGKSLAVFAQVFRKPFPMHFRPPYP